MPLDARFFSCCLNIRSAIALRHSPQRVSDDLADFFLGVSSNWPVHICLRSMA
jgi:hypothetical protein